MTDVRASDAEREATIARLRDAAAEGRLTFEELADRIEAASAAVMRSDLAPLTADLPVAVARFEDASEPVRTLGEIKRTGTWTVPAESQFRTWFGDVKLDLRRPASAAPSCASTCGRCSATSTCWCPKAWSSTSAPTPRSATSSRSRATIRWRAP